MRCHRRVLSRKVTIYLLFLKYHFIGLKTGQVVEGGGTHKVMVVWTEVAEEGVMRSAVTMNKSSRFN